MSFSPFRMVFAAVLIAVFVVSLLPASFAGSPVNATPQADSSARPRRGKNGQSVPKDAPKQDEKRNEQGPARQPQQSPAPAASPRVQSTPVGDKPVSPKPDTAPKSVDVRQSGETQRRPEPPPFDRPPASQNGSSQSGTDASDSRPSSRPALGRPPASDSRNPSRTQPRVDSRDQSSSQTAGADSTTSDDGQQQDRSSRQRPTLHRPSDNQTQSPRPPQTNEGANRSRTDEQSGVNPPQGTDDGEVIKLESTLVNIPLLVSDRSGRYIPQLSAKDFELNEDGTQQEIASFGSEEVPFNVALLLDVSPSVQGNIQDIQDAAIAFVRQLRSQDRVMVASFDRGIHYMTDFTSNRRELENAIRSIATGSGTSVYDAVYETVRRRMRSIEGRKALILFSDGEDTSSGNASYDDAINIVTESDVLVYGLRYPGGAGGNIRVDPWPRNPIPQIPIPLPWPWPRRRRWPFFRFNESPYAMNATPPAAPQRRRGGRAGGDFMADITAAGGGPVYDAEKIGDLSRLASRIADELRHVYVLSYYPTNPLSNGGYRSIRIRVKNRDDIAVRHRRGYNAREASTGRTY